jgi:DNA repair protein RadC
VSIKALPPDARPREKLLTRGAGALSDAELLALLLRSGLRGKGVLSLAQEVLDAFGGLAGLLHTQAPALQSIKGLGPAKRAELLAVLASSCKAGPCSTARTACASTCSCNWAPRPTRCLR